MAEARNDLDICRRRIMYRAGHRGTKELDLLLGRFADSEVSAMSEADLAAFEEFLALPDPDIHHWLLAPGAAMPDGLAGEFVERLKRFHDIS